MDQTKTVEFGKKVYRPVLDETLTNDDLRVARDELNETPEKREAALKRLKAKLVAQNEFTSCTDDNYLLRFLRCRKFDCEQALKSIKGCYKYRKQHPEIFLTPSKVEKVLKARIFNILPHRDHKGRAILVLQVNRWKPAEIPFVDYIGTLLLFAEYALTNPVTQINGFIGIWDYKGFSFAHSVQYCSPRNLIMMQALLLERFPLRFKCAYCINCHYLVNNVWNLLLPLLKEKLRKRIKLFGSNLKTLHESVDPRILPADFGGSNPPMDHAEMNWKILKSEPYYIYQQKFGYLA